MALGNSPEEIISNSNNGLLKIHPTWKRVKLGEVAQVLNGYAFKSTLFNKVKGKPIIRIRNIEENFSDTLYDGEWDEKYVVNKGDLLVGMDGDFKSNVWIGEPALLNQRVCKINIKNNSYNFKFLTYVLQPYLNEIHKHTSSVTVKHLSSRTIEDIPLPLPPLDEQKRIVEKIEELFSELDNAVANLKTSQQQLQTYRQSVLEHAFNGNFNHQKNEKSTLPKGWRTVSLIDVCIKIGDIDHKMPKEVTSGYPYVSTKDFTEDLKISFDKAKYICAEDYVSLSRKIKPEKGDIIFPRYGTIGKNIFIDFEKDFLVSYSCAVIKVNRALVDPKFVYWYTLSPQISKEIRKYVVETTQANVGISSIKSFIFPLTNLTEQTSIVTEIETRLSQSEYLLQTINKQLKDAESLRQSILQMAFSGDL